MKVKHILDTLMNVYIIYECYLLHGYNYLLKAVREKVLEGRSGNYCPKFMNDSISPKGHEWKLLSLGVKVLPNDMLLQMTSIKRHVL